MKNITIQKSVLTGAVLFVIGLFVFMFSLMSVHPLPASGSAPQGLNAQVATSSTLTVGPGNNTFAMGTTTREQAYQCSSRIISTTAQPIMISFASLSSTTLSQVIGFQQAASTTEQYDGGEFGCGYMTIRGLNASTTITIMETH